MRKLIINRVIRTAAVMAVGILFVILALQYDWFVSLDRAVYDLGLNARSGTGQGSDIVVIAIDKYSRDRSFPPPEFPISAR